MYTQFKWFMPSFCRFLGHSLLVSFLLEKKRDRRVLGTKMYCISEEYVERRLNMVILLSRVLALCRLIAIKNTTPFIPCPSCWLW